MEQSYESLISSHDLALEFQVVARQLPVTKEDRASSDCLNQLLALYEPTPGENLCLPP